MIVTKEGDGDQIFKIKKNSQKSNEDDNKEVDLNIDKKEHSPLGNTTIDLTTDPTCHFNKIKDVKNKLEAKFNQQIDSIFRDQ